MAMVHRLASNSLSQSAIRPTSALTGLAALRSVHPGPDSVQIDEQATSFGLKLGSITNTVTGATVSGPTGSPASMGIDFSGAAPNPGETITLRFNLPDGTNENLTLTATTDSPAGS